MKKIWNDGIPKNRSKHFDKLKEEWFIEGWKISGHTVDVMIERGITLPELKEALEYGKRTPHPQYNNQEIIKCCGYRVVIDEPMIITVYENSQSNNKWESKDNGFSSKSKRDERRGKRVRRESGKSRHRFRDELERE